MAGWRGLTNRLGFWAAHAFVLAYCGVLLGGFIVQFGENEFPCPLCILQRMAMILAAVGPAYVIHRSRSGEVSLTDYATGYGMSIVAALAGAAMAARQILLHIVPPDPGYGSAVLGLHTYTWSFITFLVVLVFCGFALLFAKETAPRGVRYTWASTALLWILAGIVAANAVAVFAEEGFHWYLPDDPTRYQLFYDLGLR